VRSARGEEEDGEERRGGGVGHAAAIVGLGSRSGFAAVAADVGFLVGKCAGGRAGGQAVR
jgi:hypothetical protein